MGDRRPLVSFTSGEFDYPPATSTNSTPVTARLDRLRRELQRTREQARAADGSERQARWGPPTRLRRRRTRDPDMRSPPQHVQQPPTPAPDLESDPADELDDGRRRGAKRRKLRHAEHADARPFTYGYYGQVEAGRLKLHLESCDGEIHDDRGRIYYGPENILQHDQSVYCTKSSRCNIVLRHHDSSPFTLERLYIIAPENGFTAPIREGLVYVAMSHEDLLPHIQSDSHHTNYLNPPRSPPHFDRNNVRLTLFESLNDPEVSRALEMNSTRDWSPFDSSADQASTSPEQEELDNPWTTAPQTPWPPIVPPAASDRALRNHPDMTGCDEQVLLGGGAHVVLLTDDEINWPEDPTTAAVLADRHRRERTVHLMDSGIVPGWNSRFQSAYTRLQRGRRTAQQPHGDAGPMTSPQFEQSRNDGVTRARFQIEDSKHKVAIKFDPPVSGTHILLKLQTPFQGKNIDIQTIIASGFAGPRFFPALQLR